ncbi:MAG: pheromone processing endoprotease [Cirrosporium novae-zelandiae]|nr:MAG: pheromone processing endoprotease [Cirrosporium novae-zelandiae]
MQILKTIALLALSTSCFASLHARNYQSRDYYAIQLDSSSSPNQVATLLQLEYEGPLGELPGHHTFSSPRHRSYQTDEILQDLRRRRRKRGLASEPLDSILWSQKQKLRAPWPKRIPPPTHEERHASRSTQNSPTVNPAVVKGQEIARTLDIQDPIFNDQWHLYNPIEVGHDVNVTGVWMQGVTGYNATVAIIDDGLDMYSDDLKGNYFAEGSYDFNEKTDEPKPRLSDDRHGTRCAGEVAAVRNNVCGVGVAYDSKVAGIRILSKPITDEDEAVAMNYEMQKNQIYSCSWGPPDDGKSMDAPGILIKRAMANAVQRGRGGKGTIYVFAAGNGAAAGDNCNFDGYTNSIYSITIGAIDRKGLHPYYSEKCSASLAVTYSSGSGDSIHTTDVGTNVCSTSHGGTSAAAPLAAGIFGLVLSVRPDLGWRDMQWLIVMTAVPVNEDDPDWQTTTIGRKYSHTYAYGKLDAWALVEAAKTWKLVKPQAWFKSPWMHVKHSIPQGDQGLKSSFTVSKEDLKAANLERVEQVTITMNLEHGRRGDVSVELHSPNGVISHLSTMRKNDDSDAGYQDWNFMSVAHWGEPGIGDWSILVKDTEVNEFSGTLVDWRLNLWGESIDASKQEPIPLPTEHDDDDHNVTTTVTAATTAITIPSETDTALAANPTDHIDRPINEKPSGASSSPTSEANTAPSSTTTTSASAATATSSNFLPTFGVSKSTQVWIYGAAALIIIFCIGLGTYYHVQRRKRILNSPRDDYEFAVVPDEEEGDAGVNQGLMGGKKKRRAGELYDAFAATESDDELFSESEDDLDENGNRYRDRDEGEINEKEAGDEGRQALLSSNH